MGEVIGLTSDGKLSPTAVELIQDMLAGPGGTGGFLRSGNNASWSYDDAAGTFTITATGGTGGGATTAAGITDFVEATQDVVGALLTASPGSGFTVSYNDPGNVVTIALNLALGNMPAGYTHTVLRNASTGLWPSTRPSARTDIFMRCLGASPAPTWLLEWDAHEGVDS